MNEAIRRAITGIVAGVALAISFTTKVSAEELDTTPEVDTAMAGPAQSSVNAAADAADSQAEQTQSEKPETDPIQQKSAENTPAQTVIEPAVFSRNMAPLASEEELDAATQVSDTEPSTLEGAIPMTLTAAEDDTPIPASSSLSVDSTSLGDAENDAGWNGSAGWRYDGQSISMVNNNTAVDVHAEGQGVSLSAAGFNRIGTLYADGDVNITGTGIVLIDTIDMLEGTKLNLLTNTDIYEDGTGSVAVFAKQEDGTYLLINGSVNGILDDTYSIPKDVHLVIPKGSSLDMRVLDCVKEVKEYQNGSKCQTFLHNGVVDPDDYMKIGSISEVFNDEEIPYTLTHALEVTFPKLTIQEGASLTIAQGGVLNMGTTTYKKANTDHVTDFVTLTIKGILELFGKIIGPSAPVSQQDGSTSLAASTDLIPSIIVQENGEIQGSGTFSFVDIQYEKQAPSSVPGSAVSTAPTDGIHAGDNCRVIVDGACPTVYAEGKNLKIIYYANACIDGIVVADREEVSAAVYPHMIFDKLNLLSEPVDPGHRLTLRDENTFVNGSLYHGDIEQAQAGLRPNDWIFPVQTNEYFGTASNFSEHFYNDARGGKYDYTKVSCITPGEPLRFYAEWGNTIDFSSLHEALDPQGNANETYRVYCLKEYTEQSDDGEITCHKIETYLLNERSSQAVPKDSIFAIEMLQCRMEPIVGPASVEIGVSQTNTGAGVLGGSNAGSLSGGVYTPILSGSRAPAGSGGNTNSGVGSSAGTDTTPGGDAPDSTAPSDPTDTPDNPDSTKDDTDYSEDVKDESDAINDKEAAAEDEKIYLDVHVDGAGTHFSVSVFLANNRLQMLNGGTVQVSFLPNLSIGWNTDDLFAVFRNADGTVTAIKVRYDPETGMISFDTPVLGDFDLICLHWEDDNYNSDAFYAAVAEYLSRNK